MTNASDVRLIVLPENLFEYLTFVFEKHCKQGVGTDELLFAGELWKRINSAPKIDFSELGKVKLENLTPNQVAISMDPKEDTPSKNSVIVEP